MWTSFMNNVSNLSRTVKWAAEATQSAQDICRASRWMYQTSSVGSYRSCAYSAIAGQGGYMGNVSIANRGASCSAALHTVPYQASSGIKRLSTEVTLPKMFRKRYR